MGWFERPLTSNQYKELAQSVMFLSELKEIIVEQILIDMYQVMNIFLGSLSEKDSTSYHLVSILLTIIKVH